MRSRFRIFGGIVSVLLSLLFPSVGLPEESQGEIQEEIQEVSNLDVLPTEIIWMITDFGNAEDTSNLRAANRRIYQLLGEKRFKRLIRKKLKDPSWDNTRVEEEYKKILKEARRVIAWNLPGLTWNDLTLILEKLDCPHAKCLNHLMIPRHLSMSAILPTLVNSRDEIATRLVDGMSWGLIAQRIGIAVLFKSAPPWFWVASPIGRGIGPDIGLLARTAIGTLCLTVGTLMEVGTPFWAVYSGISEGYQRVWMERIRLMPQEFKAEVWEDFMERFEDHEIPGFILIFKPDAVN